MVLSVKTFGWTEEAKQLLRDRYSIDGPTKLAVQLDTTSASVALKAKRLGIQKKRVSPPYEWTEEKLALLVELYPTADRETLVNRIGAPNHVIRSKAMSLGLRCEVRHILGATTRTKNNTACDYHYFDEWSPRMAWVLGFLFADGSISKRKTDVVIGLASTDEHILTHIKEETKCTCEISHRAASVDKVGHKHSKSSFLYIRSKLLVEKLAEMGLHHRKTYNDDPFPYVPDEMFSHFARGYFDGDGSIYVTSQKVCRIGIVGSPKFIGGLRDGLVRLADMRRAKSQFENMDSTPTGRITWGAVEDVKKFYRFIYPEGFPFCLERKKRKFEEAFPDLMVSS